MFCKNCGKEIPYGANFCPNCGATITRVDAIQNPKLHYSKCNPTNNLEIRSTDSLKPHCPKCHSCNISISKKGYSFGKGILLGLFTGGIGLLAGFFGMNNKKGKCLDCGYKWNVTK